MLVMAGLGRGVAELGPSIPTYLHYLENGLTSAAVGLIALAAYKLSKKIISDKIDTSLALLACVLGINFTASAWLYPSLMIFGAFVSWSAWKYDAYKTNSSRTSRELDIDEGIEEDEESEDSTGEVRAERSPLLGHQRTRSKKNDMAYITYSPRTGLWILGLWALLLLLSILTRLYSTSLPLNVLATFYFIGSIIFGGGPVVIPLLQTYVTTQGWMTDSEFLIGLALINALPGPMFNIAAFCGVLSLRHVPYGPVYGPLLGFIGIFLPGLILKTGLMPLWKKYRRWTGVQKGFKGVNSAAVGLVFAAVYLLGVKAIGGESAGTQITLFPYYVAIACCSFTLVEFLKVPAPLMILGGGSLGLLYYVYLGMP
jgi:chromate transport protein ChrA